MAKEKDKIYGVASRAWQPVLGCSPHMPCAPRCWARKTVARIVECQKAEHPARAEFFQIALTSDRKQWSGNAVLDTGHLKDPLKWRAPALIATGFHGDWGRLSDSDRDHILAVMALCPQHRFMLLTKEPAAVMNYFRKPSDIRDRVAALLLDSRLFPGDPRRAVLGNPSRAGVAEGIRGGWRDFAHNVTLGCSVMNQPEADRQVASMALLAGMGFETHVWYEPAIGKVDWTAWEFIKWMIVGGESGRDPRPFVDNWAYSTLDWCRSNQIPFWMKQMGSLPVDSLGKMRGAMFSGTDRKGSRLESLPSLLRVREIPEFLNVARTPLSGSLGSGGVK